MRRLLLTLAAILCGAAAFGKNAVHDVNISVQLQRDGSAMVTEVWKVRAEQGTEWYLVRENLGDIVISGLSVSDETGHKYIVEDEWDSDRSRSAKARRCGLIHKRKGVEICWGIGDYGERVYTARYNMSNVVKSLRDADMLHLQLLSPGISSKPEHVTVRIEGPGLTKDKVRFWGFGFDGKSWLEENTGRSEGNAAICTETTGRLKSVVVLVRFEKGLFNSSSVQNRGFESALAEALKGAKFEDEDDGEDESAIMNLLSFLTTLLGVVVALLGVVKVAGNPKKILGCRPKDVPWSREVPYGGDLLKSNYTLGRLNEIKKGNSFASALILRMIYSGALIVNKSGNDKVDISFNDSAAASLDTDSRGLYDMLKEASGSDLVLQDKEFSRWSKRNWKTVSKWVENASKHGESALRKDGQIGTEGLFGGDKYTEAGQADARKLLGFKKFLSDFTLVSERGPRDVGLWQDYLVFGAIFGIADQVAKELHDIDPKLFEEVVCQDYNTTRWLLWHNNRMAGDITNAQIRASQAMGRTSGSFGGFGGGTSFGGGGGFSGGGFGGGAR